MTKKTFNYLFNICLVVLLVFSAIGAVQAASAETFTLVFDYDAGRIKQLTVEVDGISYLPAPDTKSYTIPINHNTVRITVEAAGGYRVDKLNDGISDITPVSSTDAKKVYSDHIEGDKNFTISIQSKEYKIIEASVPGISHATKFGEKTYFYKSGEPILTLPIPSYNGYLFKGWQITDGNKINTLLEPNASGDGVDFATSQYPDNDTGSFTATPVWEGLPQDVTRKDYEYDPTGDNKHLLGSVTWQMPNGTTGVTGLDGDEGEYRSYIGYYPFAAYAADPIYYSPLARVGTVAANNTVERYYTPITYAIEYDWNGVAAESLTFEGINPTQHVYNVETPIYAPSHAGYTFAGWRVLISTEEGLTDITSKLIGVDIAIMDLKLAARTVAIAEGNTDSKIILKATWTPKHFNLLYDWNGALEQEVTFATPKPTEYVYDTLLNVPNPLRTGYIFDGWLVNDSTAAVKDLALAAESYTADITLKATWTAKQYTVKLDANGGEFSAGAVTELTGVTFDALVDPTGVTAPTRTGYTFRGFTATKNGEDFFITVGSDGALIGSIWKVDAAAPVLYARWDANPYNIILNIPNAAGVTVTVNDGAPQPYTQGTKLSVHYDDVVKFTVTAENGYKITAIGNGAVAHATAITYTYDWTKWGANDYALALSVLPVAVNPFDVNAPAGERAGIDYVDECFDLPYGSYLITCDGTTLNVTVGADGITVDGEPVDTVAIPESFFGKSVAVIKCGDSTATADSDAVSMTLAARPAAPDFDTDIAGISPFGENAISIIIKPDAPYLYEFAISTDPSGEGLVWKSLAELEKGVEEGQYIWRGLNAGTVYYVYMRVQASNGEGTAHPHGVSNDPNTSRYETAFTEYFNRRVEDILGLLEETDGAMARDLVNAAVAEANALAKPSATFHEQLEAIYDRTVAALPFAREQDAAIAELEALRNALVNSGEFSPEGVNRLDDLLSTAVSSIKSATASADISAIADKATADMRRVTINILSFGDMIMTAGNGLTQGSRLFMQAITDLSDIIAAVDAAVSAGRIEVGGNSMTPAEAIEMLQSLNVTAAYTLRLEGEYTNADIYHLRLKLPEELRTATGLQVAYYDETTGMLELLDTTRDGIYLEFTSTRIADFVILGDPTVELTSLIIALGLILACQLLAIIVLLLRRARSAKYAATHACTALPLVALTVRFLPANGLIILPILGVAVVICQIFLMYLLLSSDMFHRSTRRQKHSVQEKSLPAMATTADETDPFNAFDEAPITKDADAYVYSDASYDEPIYSENDRDEEGEAYADDETYSEEEAYTEDEAYAEDVEGYVEEDITEDNDVYVNLSTGEVFGDTDAYEDFIEPAAATRYSLPDEDGEFVPEDADVFITEDGADFAIDDTTDADGSITEDGEDFAVEDLNAAPEAPTWDYDPTESPEQLAADIPEPEPTDPNLNAFDTDDNTDFTQAQNEDEWIDDDAPVTGDLAEDLPQEEPVTGDKPKYE